MLTQNNESTQVNWSPSTVQPEMSIISRPTEGEDDWHFRLRSHYAGEIWKRSFHSENASIILRSHYAVENWKRNNHWSKLGQGNQVIIVTSSFSKCFVFKCFLSTIKSSVFKSLPSFWLGLFPWRIREHGRPKRGNTLIRREVFICFFFAWDSREKAIRVRRFEALSWIKKNSETRVEEIKLGF